jgi:hypothetical protein
MKAMMIQAYGLFWQADEVEWYPGRGTKLEFQLLGRRGSKRGNIRLADMRQQSGLYVLHDDWGVYYVGLTLDRSLGQRIKDHMTDAHDGKWDRFSWFGFKQVLKSQDANGLCRLKTLPTTSFGNTRDAIRDMEALLIRLHNPRGNKHKMKFLTADEWIQVRWDERTLYRNRLQPRN